MNASSVNWEESRAGNPVIKDEWNAVICTVYEKPRGVWRVVANVDDPMLGIQPHFVDEDFPDAEAAKKHAEGLLPIRGTLKATPSKQGVFRVTPWREQNRRSNGQPTYGRHVGELGVTVKNSQRGSWFYTTFKGAETDTPVGWFTTHQEAMSAFDLKHVPR